MELWLASRFAALGAHAPHPTGCLSGSPGCPDSGCSCEVCPSGQSELESISGGRVSWCLSNRMKEKRPDQHYRSLFLPDSLIKRQFHSQGCFSGKGCLQSQLILLPPGSSLGNWPAAQVCGSAGKGDRATLRPVDGAFQPDHPQSCEGNLGPGTGRVLVFFH